MHDHKRTGDTMIEPTLAGVVIIGLLHGLEPGHGWPIAFLYSIRKDRPLLRGFVSSSIISFFHFISSITAAVVYIWASSFADVSIPFMKYAAASVLIILAYKFFAEEVKDELEAQHDHLHEGTDEIQHEHEHEHPGQGQHTHWHKHARRIALGLWSIATFAFVLGFAHEEEFALLALAVAGVNPLLLMLFYGTAVTVALVGITLLSVKAYKNTQQRIKPFEKYIPKISAAILVLMAFAIILNLA